MCLPGEADTHSRRALESAGGGRGLPGVRTVCDTLVSPGVGSQHHCSSRNHLHLLSETEKHNREIRMCLGTAPHTLNSLSKLPNLEQEKEMEEGCRECLPQNNQQWTDFILIDTSIPQN